MDKNKSLNNLIWKFAVMFSTVAANSLVNVNSGIEYCNLEEFNVTCGTGEVILVARARYGRMKIGRCMQNDLGYMGCGGDAIPFVDRVCSGKQHCFFTIPNQQLARLNPCSSEVQPYLEVLHHCVTVRGPDVSCASKQRTVSAPGFLSSTEAILHGVASKSCPVNITAKMGQSVTVSLLYFEPLTFSLGCVSYGAIQDFASGRMESIRLCPKDERQTHLYDSVSNRISVTFYDGANIETLPRVLLKYEAAGCADLPPQPGRTATRLGGNLEVRCNRTREVWFLTCKDTEWLGFAGNCSGEMEIATDEQYTSYSYGFPIKIAGVVAIGVMLGIFLGGIFLICASLYFKRKRRQRMEQRYYDCDLEYKASERTDMFNTTTLERHTLQSQFNPHTTPCADTVSGHNALEQNTAQMKSPLGALVHLDGRVVTYAHPPYTTGAPLQSKDRVQPEVVKIQKTTNVRPTEYEYPATFKT